MYYSSTSSLQTPSFSSFTPSLPPSTPSVPCTPLCLAAERLSPHRVALSRVDRYRQKNHRAVEEPCDADDNDDALVWLHLPLTRPLARSLASP